MNTVRVAANMSLRGSLVFGINGSGFPANPQLGTLYFKDGIIYGYQLIGGIETWYPLTNRTKSYAHTQGLAAIDWTVAHNLGSLDTWFQVQDNSGNPIICARTVVDENSFVLHFTEAVEGRALVVAPDSISVPAVQTSLLTATSVNIGGGSVLFSVGAGSINGSPILTEAALGGTFATLTDGRVPPSQLPTDVAYLVGGKIQSSQLPALAITDTFVVSSQAEMLGLSAAEQGDVAIRSDLNKSFILTTDNPAVLANWQEMLAPLAAVSSVNGSTGAVVISTITGNAGTATKLQTPRTISLSGDVTGSVSFDGSGNADIVSKLSGDPVVTKTFNGATAVDYSNEGSYVVGNVTGATTLSITGVPNDGRAYGMTFELNNAGTNVTWPAGWTWLGTTPTLRASGKSVITGVTHDGGSTWLASAA